MVLEQRIFPWLRAEVKGGGMHTSDAERSGPDWGRTETSGPRGSVFGYEAIGWGRGVDTVALMVPFAVASKS